MNKPVLCLSAVVALLVGGCATSSKNFKAKDVEPGEGIFLGSVKIFIDGEDFTKHCYVGFNSDRKPYISLDETGLVIGKAKAGKTDLSYFICTDYGILTVSHKCEWSGATFENVGHGKKTYFGNVTIDWKPSDTGTRKALALLGGLGAGIASTMNSCGAQKVTVTDESAAVQKAYRTIASDDLARASQKLEKRLISVPGTGAKAK